MEQERERKPRSRKKDNGMAIKIAAAALAGVIALSAGAAVIYIQMGQKYKKVFFPNTSVNGMDVSKKHVDEVKQLISAQIDGYTLTVKARGQEPEAITKDEIGLESVFNGSLEELLAGQNPNRWWSHRKKPSVYEIDTMIQYDESAFEKRIAGLACLEESSMKPPEDAKISDYTEGQGYRIVPEVPGTALDQEAAVEAISQAILDRKETVSLEEAGFYQAPGKTAEDPVLVEAVSILNQYVQSGVVHKFGSSTETLMGSQIAKWLSVGGDGQVSIDQQAVAAYAKQLADRYDTYNMAKEFKTTYGKNVKISQGSYGWKMNQGAETDEIIRIIKSGEKETREPVYSQKAASREGNGIGDTYVEINLTAQHLYFYKNGKLVVESDFVSGNLSKGWGTPAGVYSLTYKQRDAVLKGEDYRTPVDYWMPFNGGIGLHDAKWRSTFGGTLYKNGGSHGCINLPHSVAKTIYENIPDKCPVVCYNLDGTESSKASSGTKVPETTAPKPTEAPTPTQTPAQTPAVTEPESTAPKPTESVKPPVETSPTFPETSPSPTPSESKTGPSGSESGSVETGKAAGPAA